LTVITHTLYKCLKVQLEIQLNRYREI
jgi:hypothetical protein